MRLTSPHADLLPTVRDGRKTFRLLSNDAIQNQFFDNWAHQLSRKSKFKTVKTYCYAVKVFLNYIMQMALHEGGLTPHLLSYALGNYESYLVFGTQSGSDKVRAVAEVLGDRNLKGSSVVTNFAAVNRFIAASERLRMGLLELEAQGLIVSSELSGFSLQSCVSIEAPVKVRAALKNNSWLAGCIAGGAKRIKRAGLSSNSKPSDIAYTDEFGGDELTFPIDHCRTLIENAPSLRDKLLWSLLAATGCRVSEALTMLSKDVVLSTSDLESNKVLIVDPATRHHVLLKRSNRRFGLDLHLVQKYMGHASPDSTRRYARQDAHMLQATISAVNFSRISGGPQTVRQARIAFLKSEIALLENHAALEAS
ncbi:site-specific integrase [Pseudomonas putida]|nr:site-specific integrase [Pseudomonas putida]